MELFGVSGSCHAEICGTEIIRLSIVQVDTVMKKLKLKLCVWLNFWEYFEIKIKLI